MRWSRETRFNGILQAYEMERYSQHER